MSVRFKILLILITVLSFCCFASAQTAKLNRFRSGCGFGINLPRFTSVEKFNETVGGVTSNGGMYTWTLDDGRVFRVLCMHVSSYGKPLSSGAKSRYLANSMSEFVKGIEESDKNYEVDQMPFESNGISGGEMRLSFADREVIVRSFMIGDRAILLIGAYAPGTRDLADVVEILNSFRRIAPIELNDAKIEEATPDELPQDPMLWKRTTDAADDNLKGKVQSVIEEFAEAGKSKQRQSEEYYDKNRNLVKSIDYLDGLPKSVSVWGVLDGARVRNRGEISFDPDQRTENPDSKTIYMVERAGSKSAKSDTRFSERFVYKYSVDGKLIEVAVYDNTGELSSRRTIVVAGNRVETTYFGSEGKKYAKGFEVLDRSGNVIEYWSEGEPKSESVHCEYKFDDRGNWIEKNEFQEKIVGRKPVRTPLGITYRTITYFPDSE